MIPPEPFHEAGNAIRQRCCGTETKIALRARDVGVGFAYVAWRRVGIFNSRRLSRRLFDRADEAEHVFRMTVSEIVDAMRSAGR
jgi:hypothetical protein